jgi:Zn finger protein HypA/HybF involved in hydrogenase expression
MNCLQCSKEIEILNKYSKRKKFCSRSCSGTYNNSRREIKAEWWDSIKKKNSQGTNLCSTCNSKLKNDELDLDMAVCYRCLDKKDSIKFVGGMFIKNIQIIEALHDCKSITKTCEKLEISPSITNRKKISLFIRVNSIDVSHFEYGSSTRRNLGLVTMDDFCINSTRDYGTIKQFIIRNKILDHTTCQICKHINEWEGKELSLQMDHINGINNDHRLENLRFLCPNCHSQTHTFGNKNRKFIKSHQTPSLFRVTPK